MDEDKIIQENELEESIKSNEQKRNKNIILTVLKRHKLALLIIVFLMMVSSTFAWFIYNKTVDMTLHAHVKAWNIHLGEEDESEDAYEIKIAALYPGMRSINTVTDGGGIPIVNNGELTAAISINITSITLFGVEQEKGVDYTLDVSADGKTFTVTGYPFVLTFVLDASQLTSNARSALNYSLVWDYDNLEAACTQDENGNPIDYNRCDVEDTEMGEASYEYSANNPNGSSLVIKMNMDVTQVN